MSECDFRTSKFGGLSSPGLWSHEKKYRVFYKMMAYVILVLLTALVVQLTMLNHAVLCTRQNLC